MEWKGLDSYNIDLLLQLLASSVQCNGYRYDLNVVNIDYVGQTFSFVVIIAKRLRSGIRNFIQNT